MDLIRAMWVMLVAGGVWGGGLADGAAAPPEPIQPGQKLFTLSPAPLQVLTETVAIVGPRVELVAEQVKEEWVWVSVRGWIRSSQLLLPPGGMVQSGQSLVTRTEAPLQVETETRAVVLPGRKVLFEQAQGDWLWVAVQGWCPAGALGKEPPAPPPAVSEQYPDTHYYYYYYYDSSPYWYRYPAYRYYYDRYWPGYYRYWPRPWIDIDIDIDRHRPPDRDRPPYHKPDRPPYHPDRPRLPPGGPGRSEPTWPDSSHGKPEGKSKLPSVLEDITPKPPKLTPAPKAPDIPTPGPKMPKVGPSLPKSPLH